MYKEGNCQCDRKCQKKISREQLAVQDVLLGTRNSSELRQKLVSTTKLPKAAGLIVTISSPFTAGLGISGQFLSIHWISSYIITGFLTYRREQELFLQKAFIYTTFHVI